MSIEEKLAAKKQELLEATADQEARWTAFQKAEQALRQDHQTPWHNALERQRALQKDIAILEGVLNEMASV